MKKKLSLFIYFSFSLCVLGQQHKVLPSTSVARFTKTDRVWSTTYGNINVCQWKDDKLAAITITIDDNHYLPDNSYWMQKGTETGWKWTWFLIPSRIDSNPAYNGNWAQWTAVKAAGHDLQSHSQNHCSANMLSTDLEYSVSKNNINNNISGANVQALAYPNGYPGCSNDSIIAKNYYLSSRGVYGAIADITKMNFHNANSIGNLNNFFDAESHFASFQGVLNPSNSLKFRAWYITHFHNLSEAHKTQIDLVFNYIQANQTNIWVANYTEAAKYAQEFASHQITNPFITPDLIKFNLSDQMYDSWYNQELTVKVNITGWDNLTATQNGNNIDFQIVENGSNKYALIYAIPDGGEIILSKAVLSSPIYENNTVKIYPIPFEDKVNIISENSNILDIKVYDQLSRLVYEKKVNNSNVNVITDQLPSGSYEIVISLENKKIIRKHIIK